MKFKEWLQIDETRFKGLYRQFAQQYPNVPDYVLKQIYNNRVSHDMQNALNNQNGYNTPYANYAPQQTVNQPNNGQQNFYTQQTVDYTPGAAANDFSQAKTVKQQQTGLLSNATNNGDMLKDVVWSKKPMLVNIAPGDFDDKTVELFRRWRFGYDPKDQKVRNDTQRFQIQRNLMMQRQADNEPIIMIREGNKYRLIEGFHRTMMYLLSPHNDAIGAPPDQIQMLQSGQLDKLDFSRWSRVPIKAYIGVRQSTGQQAAQAAPQLAA